MRRRVLLDDIPRAQELYKLLLPYANRCVVTSYLMCYGSASRLLGLLATTLSRNEDAERHFQQALKMNAQIKAPLLTARTQQDYARLLIARAQPYDREKAIELLTQALTTAEELGLQALAEKTRPLILRAEAANPQPTRPKRA